MTKILFSAFSFAGACAVFGTDFYLKPYAEDWSLAASYCSDAARTTDAATAPGAADTIFVPSGTFALASGTASFATFANAYRIAPEQADSVIELNVADGTAENPHVVNAMIYHGLKSGSDAGVGVVVKKGAGFLYLAAKNAVVNNSSKLHAEYGVNFDVRAGALRFATNELNNVGCGYLKVASGAAVWMAQSPSSATQMRFDYIEAEEGSLLTNATTRSSGHVIGTIPCNGVYDRVSYVKGAIGGNLRIWSSGSIRLDTVQNTSSAAVTATDNYGNFLSEKSGQRRGVIYVKTFGGDGTPSSLGTGGSAILGYGPGGGGFSYIGPGGETTCRFFDFYGSLKYTATTGAYPTFLDAGTTGGVTFTGPIRPYSDGSNVPAVRRLVLRGDNADECVIAGAIDKLVKDGVTYPIYLTKAGTGTWRLADHAGREHVGVTAVADGTLKFDSIDEKGSMCALGRSTVLTIDDSRAVTNGDYVGYAFVLGDANGSGRPVFEYSGATAAACSTRPLVLAGAGGTLKASSGALDFRGVSARDENTSPTLTLDGTGTDNVVGEISNGVANARVNVVKKGGGTWTLDGNLTFSGSVKAEEGVLRVNVPHPIAWPERNYTWYRLSIAQIGTNNNTKTLLQMRQICLFDKDGVRQNAGLTNAVEVAGSGSLVVARQKLKPGQAWLDFLDTNYVYTVTTGYADFLSACFRETDGYSDVNGRLSVSIKKGTTDLRPDPADSTTWIPIVMRLADDAHPIAYFDIQGFSNTIDAYPTRFQLEGSVDGLDWNVVWSNVNGPDQAPVINNYNRWVSDGTAGSNSSHARPVGTGFTTSAQAGKVYDHFNWYRLSVARIGTNATAGSTLSIRQIGLYDARGSRVNAGLTQAETPGGNGETRVIQGTTPAEGQVGYGASAAGLKVCNQSPFGKEIQSCFDGYHSGGVGGVCHVRWLTAAGSNLAPVPDDRKTWIPIVMHLPADCGPVTHFDVENYARETSTMPSRMMLEGSTNGVNWQVIYDNATQGEMLTPAINNYNQWVSDGTYAGDPPYVRLPGKGLTVSASHPSDPETKDQFAHVSAVSVAAGATLATTAPLPLAGLQVNAAGAGTLDGFAFAASGTLDVVGTGSLTPLPGAYVNCTDLANLAKWSVSRDGVALPHAEIKVLDGAVYVLKSGLTIMVR